MDRDALAAWQWRPQPAAAAVVRDLVQAFLARCAPARALATRMLEQTGTRFVDWLDHLAVPLDASLSQRLESSGFTVCNDATHRWWAHAEGDFPDLLVADLSAAARWRAAIAVESVADAAAALGSAGPLEGEPWAPLRRVLLARDADAELWAVERHGSVGFTVPSGTLGLAARRWLDAFRTRPRAHDGFAAARTLIGGAVRDIGRDAACDVFFAAERDYWQRRCRAGRVQKARQDDLGLGWANHDHHTYRSSRGGFRDLIACLELLGMRCRERFYAGGEAGWGAQVLEQPATGVVVFADVDLSPDELAGDFPHLGLPERGELGTVGLWCALHGEAFLAAGMHHLEAMFAYDHAVRQLAALGVASMPPFTDYPYLRQCFTEAERWPVPLDRIAALARDGRIEAAQAERFAREGALGSHLEILERNDGFRGFNQKGVSEIIAKTDPRGART